MFRKLFSDDRFRQLHNRDEEEKLWEIDHSIAIHIGHFQCLDVVAVEIAGHIPWLSVVIRRQRPEEVVVRHDQLAVVLLDGGESHENLFWG